jgi:uncharacterized protein
MPTGIPTAQLAKRKLTLHELRCLIASDLHGSNACFKKLVALADEVRADICVVAGDISGKRAIIGYPENQEHIRFHEDGRNHTVRMDEFEVLRAQWGNIGIYGIRVKDDVPSVDEVRLESEAKRLRLTQWLDFAKKRFAPAGRRLFIMPGNDDSPDVVETLNFHNWATNIDDNVVRVGDYALGGLGYSNPTPWQTYRELSESQLSSKLNSLAAALGDCDFPLVAIHVPPLDSGLDLAPEVVRLKNGEFATRPGRSIHVGSSEVHKFVTSFQPILLACGHCHDSAGFRFIGKSLCLNAGSVFQIGTLNAALVILERGSVKGFQNLVR